MAGLDPNPRRWATRAKRAALSTFLAGGIILARAQPPPTASALVAATAPAPAPSPDSGTLRFHIITAPAIRPNSIPPGQPKPKIYVIPIKGEMDVPQLYLLRRALKEATANKVDTVILDLDTRGGSLKVMFDMLEAISKYPGNTYAYVDDQAVAAGAFVAAAATQIYFKPKVGRLGVFAEGLALDESLRARINSALGMAVRELNRGDRYRAPVLRALMDPEVELKIDDDIIKPKGQWLMLSGEAACWPYGNPREKLLGAGLTPDVDALATQLLGQGNYALQNCESSWWETLAKGVNSVAPILLGAGILLLLIEFKSTGTGLAGIAGLGLLLVFFAGQHVAGLAGWGPVLLFAVGMIFFALELLVFIGSMLCAILGVICLLVSFVWAMTDAWPGQSFGGVTFSTLGPPLLNVAIAMTLAGVGFALILRFSPGNAALAGPAEAADVPNEGDGG